MLKLGHSWKLKEVLLFTEIVQQAYTGTILWKLSYGSLTCFYFCCLSNREIAIPESWQYYNFLFVVGKKKMYWSLFNKVLVNVDKDLQWISSLGYAYSHIFLFPELHSVALAPGYPLSTLPILFCVLGDWPGM